MAFVEETGFLMAIVIVMVTFLMSAAYVAVVEYLKENVIVTVT